MQSTFGLSRRSIRRWGIALAALAVLCAASCNFNKTESGGTGTPSASAAKPVPGAPVKLNTAYLPITAYLPLYVAVEKGYFKALNLDVSITEATTPNDIVTAMAAGKIDFAAALAYTILFPAQNQYPDLFRLYSSSEETEQNFTSSIIVKPDSPLKSYRDLRGKKVGVYSGIVQVLFLKAMLKGMGIPPEEVKIVEISPRLQIQGLAAGEYDALSCTEPTSNIAIAQGQARALEENPRVKFIMSPFPSTAAAISNQFIGKNPAAAEAVAAALDLAVDFIQEHPAEAKRLLPKYTPIPKDSEQKVLDSLKLFKFCKLGQENRANVQKFANYLSDGGLLKKPIADVNPLFAR